MYVCAELLETKYAKNFHFRSCKAKRQKPYLTGLFDEPTEEADVTAVLTEIKEAV